MTADNNDYYYFLKYIYMVITQGRNSCAGKTWGPEFQA